MQSVESKILPFAQIPHSVEGLHARHLTKSRIIYLLVILALFVFLGAMPFIFIHINTQSRGILRTEQQNNALTTAIYGQITEQHLAENKTVQKGDLLVVLNSDQLDQKILFQKEKILQNQAFIQDLRYLLADSIPADRLETPLFQISYFQYQKQESEYQLKIDQAQRVLDRNQALYDGGVIARADYEEYLFQRDVQLKMLEAFSKQQKKSWEIEVLQYQNQIQEAQASIQQLQQEKRQYEIRAPISGTVTQFTGQQAGNFISPGQTLAQIAATDSLIVECYVSPSDIGFLYENMPVRFQVDAFNYNQWGLAEGQITMISKDVIMVEEQPSFLVRCQLDTPRLQLKNGYTGELKKGMTLTARFQLSKRSLYQLLYDKVDDWLNPNLATS